ncbi:MAG: hypothetical protein GY761_09640 [Hyphomicrobiales bacterium]|nr:hypothetical protein [Hyphomicrobiales bacterium]
MSSSIIFVIDPPQLIAEAVPLVISLRQYMPDAHVIAYCPDKKEQLIPPMVREIFTKYRIELRYFDATRRFEPNYRQGNKILAAAEPRETKYTLFLDTDIVAWKRFPLREVGIADTVLAAPEGMRSWPAGNGDSWEKAYGHFAMDVPTSRVRLVKTGGQSEPYFNGGVLAFPNVLPNRSESFGELWLQTAQDLDSSSAIMKTRPWLDQVSFPICIARAKLRWTALPIEWNLSLSRPYNRDPLPSDLAERAERAVARIDSIDAYFLHYHKPKFFWHTKYEGYLDRLISDNTAFENYRTFARLLKP